MKLIIATTLIPFSGERQDVWAGHLAAAYKRLGHQVELVQLPFWGRDFGLLDEILGLQLLDLTGYGDRLIVLRSPSYFLPHPHKIVWFSGFLPGFYHTWETPLQNWPVTPAMAELRKHFLAADGRQINACQSIFAVSSEAARKLRQYHRSEVQVLLPPGEVSADAEVVAGDYVVYAAPIRRENRQALAVESMRQVKTGVKLFLTGPCLDSQALESLKTLIAHYGLGSKICWLPPSQESERRAIFADSMAVLDIPFRGDHAADTLQAFGHKKPVVTCEDSGAPAEQIETGKTGWILPPDPSALAAAFDDFFLNRSAAMVMGEAGSKKSRTPESQWDLVAEKLLK